MIVHNKGDYIRNGLGVRLLPGVNNVNDAAWERFKAHPLNKKLIDSGELVPQEKGGQPKKFAEMGPKEAVALVEDTYDLNLLADLLTEEEAGKKRKTVIEAISKQAETVENDLEEARKKAENEQNGGGSENE